VLPDITIRPANPEDDERVLAIYNTVRHDAPPTTAEAYRYWIASRPDHAGLETWVAETDTEVAGELVAWEYWDIDGPGVWGAVVEVAEGYTRRGIGGLLYDHLLDLAAARHIHRLYGEVREDRPDGMAFATARGFAPTGRVNRNARLAVRDADVAELEAIEERLRADGIHIATLAEIGADDDAFLRALHRMHEDAMMDVPSSRPFEPRPYERWLNRTLRYTGYSPETTWVALHDERPVGVARVRCEAQGWLNNSFTGVDRSYRGRGVAQALKLRSIEWACGHDIAFIYTANDLENTAMLAVNRKLGYKPLPASIEMVKDL
jgi:GNAT superfamily N-acetyltransferase